ncbi:MAG: SDR family oxidoreductase, partial [Nocardia sp.]|nr:SDR family oxidoreductase [Nocardia sp.]
AAAGAAGRALGVGAHAADEDAARACVEQTVGEFGGVDILVNNAATNPYFGPTVGIDHARFAKTFDVNLWAPILWTSLVTTAWMAEHGGSVINIASIGGMSHEANIGVYNASKAALIHLTEQLALELSPTVRVNAIAPGLVRTRMAEALWRDYEHVVAAATALDRIGEPTDIAPAIAFLVSDAAKWITGQVLAIDGGQVLGSPALFRMGVRQ